MSDYRCNQFLPETSTRSVDKSLIIFSEEEECSNGNACQIEGLISFVFFLPDSKSVFISSTVAPSPPLRKRPLPIDTCHRSPVGLACLLCSSSHNFIFSLFSPSVLFFCLRVPLQRLAVASYSGAALSQSTP